MPRHDNTHGLSKDKRYWRWMIIHNRCYKEKNPAYSSYGAKGIRVDWEWHRDNPEGLYNFLEWLETKLKEAENPQKYVVALQDQTKNYGPNNCILTTQQVAIQRRAMNRYTSDQVVEMRRYAKANPHATLEDIAAIYGGTTSSLSQALTGTTYSNVDALEPPIPFKQRNHRLGKTTKKTKPAPNASVFALGRSLRPYARKLGSLGE
ncbi:hypothetical protein [Burkholderia phage FLC9]|nr:hypothetical protein [Burkholderia phage FLC9]